MNSSLARALSKFLAIAAGLVLFVHYFAPGPAVEALAQPLLSWIVLLSGAALLFAAANLLRRHVGRLQESPISGFLVLGFVATLIAGLLPAGFEGGAGQWLYRWIIASGLAALFALLPIFLAYALYRHLSFRDLGTLLLAISLIVVLLGQTPWLAEQVPLLAALRHDVLIGPSAAALRGVLIGLAAGTVLNVLGRARRAS